MGLPFDVLRVDDGHATRANRKMIDIGATSGDAAVVEEHDVGAAQVLREPFRGLAFAGRAQAPCLLVLRIVELRQRGADHAELLSPTLDALRTPPLAFGGRRSAGESFIENIARLKRTAALATNRPRRGVVPCLASGAQRCIAASAYARVAKTDEAFGHVGSIGWTASWPKS